MPPAASGQDGVGTRDSLRTPPAVDMAVLTAVYGMQQPAFRGVMRAANATAYPVFVGGPVLAWGGRWLAGRTGDWTDAYRLTLSEGVALAGAMVLKYSHRRTRPYVRLADIESRSGDIARWDPYSFPSGHAALAFAMATSWTLSYQHWYVAVPSFAWASTVAVSRIWLGVHYPTDVLAGTVLGVGAGIGVYLLRAYITPEALRPSDEQADVRVFAFRLAF